MNEFDRKVILSKIDEIDFNNEDDKYIQIVKKHLDKEKSGNHAIMPKVLNVGHIIFYDDYINAWRFFNYDNLDAYRQDVYAEALTKDKLLELLK